MYNDKLYKFDTDLIPETITIVTVLWDATHSLVLSLTPSS